MNYHSHEDNRPLSIIEICFWAVFYVGLGILTFTSLYYGIKGAWETLKEIL